MMSALRMAAAGLASSATSVAALAPPLPDCSGDMLGAAERQAIGVTDPDWFGYYYDSPLDGFALYSFQPDADTRRSDGVVIFEHCATGTQVFVRVSPRGVSEEAFHDLWNRIDIGIRERARPDNPRTYSMEDLADFARGEGARARVQRVGYQSCACAFLVNRGW